jgi:membrane associated rhomboid family serine protease
MDELSEVRKKILLLTNVPEFDIDATRTVSISFLLLITFKTESILADRNGYTTVFSWIQDLYGTNAGLLILSPIMHSDSSLLIGNPIILIPLSLLMEQRLKIGSYLFFVYFVGVLGNAIIPPLLSLVGISTGFGIGISGVTHAMASRETVYRTIQIFHSSNPWLLIGWVVAVSVFSLHFLVIITGSTPPSVSLTAHASGLFIGVLSGVLDHTDYTIFQME